MNQTDLMTNYKLVINELVHEKIDRTCEQIETKTQKAKELAKTIFEIDGNDTFKGNVKDDLNSICEVKPGRILIKALSKFIFTPIKIKQGTSDNFIINQNTYNVCIEFSNERTRKYYTIFDEKLSNQPFPTSKQEQCPSFVRLAHEMIHLFHYKMDEKKFNKRITNISMDVFPFMDTREEQYTIAGIDEPLLTKKINQGKLEKADIVCENSFLLALNLAPRNCHHDDVAIYNKNQAREITKDLETAYYNWLEDNLFRINNIPESNKTDKEFIKNFASKYPKALKSIDYSLKRDKEFFLDLIEYNKDAIKYLPIELLQDKDFLISLINQTLGSYFRLPKDIRLSNKELALFVIKKKQSWYHLLDKELQDDPLFTFAKTDK